MPYFYGFDWTYIYIVLPCLLLSIWASSSVNSTFKRYSKQLSSRGITGRDAAICVLEAHGIHNVRVERIAGNLTDHFDPKTNVIRLSDNVYDSTSTAAIGVACHEAGHAVITRLTPEQLAAMHAANESIGASALAEGVKFYKYYIKNR